MKQYHSIFLQATALLLATVIILSVSSSAFGEIRLDATILPESDNTFLTVFTVNSEALGFFFPSQNNKYYLLYWDDLPSMLSQFIGFDLSEIKTDELSEELLTTLALRYGKIIISVCSIFNFSRKKTTYDLSAFHISPQCVVWACSPSRREWSKMLTELFSTAISDHDLTRLLSPVVMELLHKGQDQIPRLVNILDGVTFSAATDDNNIYAISVSKNSNSICYQYPGVPSSEYAIVYKDGDDSDILIYAVSDLNSSPIREASVRICSVEELSDLLSVFLCIVPSELF